jgi:outer membrane receptor protein involved in Fe transport
MKKCFLLTAILLAFTMVWAQPGGPGGQGKSRQGANGTGRVYGKILDASTKDPVEYAVLQVFELASPSDSAGKLLGGGLSEGNGDFSIDNIPLDKPLILRINFIGYTARQVPFQLSRGSGGFGPVEKDLGNIRLDIGISSKEVVIEGENPEFRMDFDKRVYDVEKNPMNAGGTGEDVLRNIPSLNVDVDGNVSLRNAAPTIFVDGRPTTLTIDQIPADAIQRVELITNPSAKYDAGSGNGGIVNIVLKTNRSTGYNGSVRIGTDKRQRGNGGFDFNAKQGKLNFFASGNVNQRRVITNGYTRRLTTLPGLQTDLDQTQEVINDNLFLNGRTGIDFFADNRNTYTLNGNFTAGRFRPDESIYAVTDTLSSPNEDATSIYTRESLTERRFQNLGGSFLYKHLFAKEGTELTADVNANAIRSRFLGDYVNRYDDAFQRIQRQEGGVRQTLITSQIDFVSKINDKTKIEAGARAQVRDYSSTYDNFFLNNSTGIYEEIRALAVNYDYLDQVYALYTTYSKDAGSWRYQVGLRGESSRYDGELTDTTVTFGNRYPLVLLPSAFVTKVINEKQDVQFAFSRKVSRPSFMQLSPFTDLSDSLNVSRGNPNLRPEFTHNVELSWQYSANKKNTFIASAYTRYTTDITVRYQLQEFNPVIDQEILVNTYDNAAYSLAYGLEIVAKNSLTPWLDLTTNVNFFNSRIDGTNLTSGLTNNISSWWAKMNMLVKLPSGLVFQALGEYNSRRALEVGSSERGGGGGGGGGGSPGNWGGSNNTVQGFVRPQYSLDLSLKKELFKNKSGAITLSFQDVFRTRVTDTFGTTPFFVQDTFRRRDPQFWRLNFSWKFGKIDATLFKRKNMRGGEAGMEG